jgi:hypothetical protein
MEFSDHSQLVSLCDNDEFIMDAFRIRGNCTPLLEMQRLNACRMHLKVSRVSEILCTAGLLHRSDVLKGSDSAIHLSASGWPRQARPLPKDWAFWSQKLRLVFSVDGGNTHRLRHPLGAWHSTAAVLEWPTLISLHSREAYIRLVDGTYQVHQLYAELKCLLIKSLTPLLSMLFLQTSSGLRISSRRGESTFGTRPPRLLPFYRHRVFPNTWPHNQAISDVSCVIASTLVLEAIYSTKSLFGRTDGGLLNGLGTFWFSLGLARA